MGAYLTSPVRRKFSEFGENEKIIYGCTEMQGWRIAQEDAHNCIANFDENASIFGVYDGHGGPEISEFAAFYLPRLIKSSKFWQEGDIKLSLIDSFLKFDSNLLNDHTIEELKRMQNSQIFARSSVCMSPQEDDVDENTTMRYGKVFNCDLSSEDVSCNCKIIDMDHVIHTNKNINFPITPPLSPENNSSLGAEKSIKLGEIKLPSPRRRSLLNSPLVAAYASSRYVTKNQHIELDTQNRMDCEERFDSMEMAAAEIADEMDIITPGLDSGSTACVLIIKSDKLYVANIGDSRCVLCRNGMALDLSVDHKPEDPLERARIEQAGGWLDPENRINGMLNLSRSFGDHSKKTNPSLPQERQIVSPYPDVRVETLLPDDRFIILACDGLWNSLTSQEMVDLVSRRLSKGLSPVDVCKEICDMCLADSCTGDDTGCDNMTIIIVKFKEKP